MDSFNSKSTLQVGDIAYDYYSINALEASVNVSHLPFSLKILLENLLRNEDGSNVTDADIRTLAAWSPDSGTQSEIAFMPARVLMQDFTGVPAVVDLAAMRDAMKQLGGDPAKINPLAATELVIDHSVQVDYFGSQDALKKNAAIEFERNKERYEFLRWGSKAFSNFRVVPPDTGIVHQVNLEYLARGVFPEQKDGKTIVYPDTVVGTDSHTTMINGLGVLGWGVGGIEAEAVMLGQPISMLIPQVIGFRLTGQLADGVTATDLVLTIVEQLRQEGVVGKFVEFFGPALNHLSLADRATISNMAPEYGATCGIFPVDQETIKYLQLSGRSPEQIALVEAYAKAQGMWRYPDAKDASYTKTLELDIANVEPSLAGPRRPQDRITLEQMKTATGKELDALSTSRSGTSDRRSVKLDMADQNANLGDGDVVIAAITSCTNTSNPSVMVGAGLLAKKAVERGLSTKPWVKTSLAPGSLVVTRYLDDAQLTASLDQLGFNSVGYGCTTCIGNSGPLPEPVSKAVIDNDLIVASVLSGNRNFEGRVHALVQLNFLASPALVIAYALAGTTNINLNTEALGTDQAGNPVFLKDIWPSQQEVNTILASSINAEMFQASYNTIFDGDSHWQSLDVTATDLYEWKPESTYVKNPPYFAGMSMQPEAIEPIQNARCLALLGDSITTDHISPAGVIQADSPAGRYLTQHGVEQKDFNSYGARRGNHEVMMRGTFANIRLRNQLVTDVVGGWTKHIPSGEQMPIYDAAERYQQDAVPLIILAGKEYGCGSSRDWAAKGPRLQGVRAVLAESFERIHRSNLVGMGILPLTFHPGDNANKLGLDGTELFDIAPIKPEANTIAIMATKDDGTLIQFEAIVRIDTPKEWDYFQHGGILHYVLRQLANSE
ncbi:MAG TPA: aconitate hydratase AcnA [Crenotrichaceae bacterium]|nr:aconitate hydratase AcnA [Crenotrichaceae bacterium]